MAGFFEMLFGDLIRRIAPTLCSLGEIVIDDPLAFGQKLFPFGNIHPSIYVFVMR